MTEITENNKNEENVRFLSERSKSAPFEERAKNLQLVSSNSNHLLKFSLFYSFLI